MLPKENRLKKKKDFERVFKEGRGFKEGFLIFKFLPNNLKESRFGIVVGSRVSKKATLRNKIRRRLRELLRLKLPEIKEKIDGVLVALPGLETKSFWELKELIEKILKKTKII